MQITHVGSCSASDDDANDAYNSYTTVVAICCVLVEFLNAAGSHVQHRVLLAVRKMSALN